MVKVLVKRRVTVGWSKYAQIVLYSHQDRERKIVCQRMFIENITWEIQDF